MTKIISFGCANAAGRGMGYTDGSSVKFIASLNKTIITDRKGNETIVEGDVVDEVIF